MNPYWPRPDSRLRQAEKDEREQAQAEYAERVERFRVPSDAEVEATMARREGRDIEQDHGGAGPAVDEWYEAERAALREWREFGE